MELKLTHEPICINEVVFDGTLEQAIELDYLLPDYCPSIFKILKCKVVPKITSERIANGKLMIDGIAYIKIMYVSEENYHIRSITQKQVFSKSMELKENCNDGVVTAFVKCDYVNCRVINQHRLDIRGAISIKTTVSVAKKLEVLSKVSGMGVQVCNQKLTALDKKLFAYKEFSIKEELELSYGKPNISEMLDCAANAILTEYKLIANKVIVKGEILLHTIYLTDDEQATPQIMEHTVPMSQIVDISGISEEYKCVVDFDVTAIEINLKQNGDGEYQCFDAEFSIRVRCEANKNEQAQLISDIYSTNYEVQSASDSIKIEQLINCIEETCICKNAISISQGEVSCVYDISGDFVNQSCKFDNGFIVLTGNLCISILALDNENMPVMIEKNADCEMRIDAKCNDENMMFTPHVTVSSISYSLISNMEIEVRAEIKVCGNLFKFAYYNVLNTVNVDETHKKECNDNAVLRLYFAQTGEQVWNIAKRFNTSVDAIILENNLECETLTSPGMLLIPIMN